MRIIKHVAPACRCMDKLWAMHAERSGTPDSLEVGTIIECDCGTMYKLVEHQCDGLFWQWYHPDSGDMGKR